MALQKEQWQTWGLVSSHVWWEAATIIGAHSAFSFLRGPGVCLDFGPEHGPGKGTMADLGPLIRPLVSTRLPSGGRAALLSPFVPLVRH